MWRTHVWARLSGQKGAQSLSIPVVGIQIHKYDGPGTALQSRNTVRDNILVTMNQLSCIYLRKWTPDGPTAKPESTSAVFNSTTVKSGRYLEFYMGLNNSQVRALPLLIKHLQWGCYNTTVHTT